MEEVEVETKSRGHTPASTKFRNLFDLNVDVAGLTLLTAVADQSGPTISSESCAASSRRGGAS